MTRSPNTLTYVGGPTALIEVGGFRLLTDPTFDPAGGDYPSGPVTLHKTEGPAVSADVIGPIDAVLLSHEHHFDNLDRAGRAFLSTAERVITTPAGATTLGGNAAVGLAHWESITLTGAGGQVLTITGTPSRHGPDGGDRGPVTGFVLSLDGETGRDVYISGDTVWYEGVAEVARRFSIATAVLFMGAARIPEVGPHHITMTADDALKAAAAFGNALIIPLHFEGWKHLSESKSVIQDKFAAAGLSHRLRWPQRGVPIPLFG